MSRAGGTGNARWSSNGPDGQLLHSLIMSGNLEPGVTPGQLQTMYPQFAKYNSNAFATNFRRVKQLYAAGEIQDQGNGLSSGALALKSPPPLVMSRTTPSSPGCRPSISFASSVGGRHSAEKSLNDSFSGLAVDEDAESGSLPMCGSPAISSAKTSHVFCSAPTDIKHFFWSYPWFDCHSNHRLTYYILLSSLNFEYYTFLVSACGWYLQILMRLPFILTDTMQLTSKLHRKPDGTPAFGMDNIRHVNHRLAVESLMEAMGVGPNQETVLTQSIRLPFQVDSEFCKFEGTDGLMLKYFQGGMQMAVVEMIGIKSSRNHSTAIRQVQQQHYIDEVSLSGYYTTVPRQLDTSGASVISINPRTGAPRASTKSPASGGRIPSAISVRKLAEIEEMGGDDDDLDDYSLPSARITEGGKRRGISSPRKKKGAAAPAGTLLLRQDGEQAADSTMEDDEGIVEGKGYQVDGVTYLN